MQHSTYSTFVQSEDDLTGLVAYAIYKGDKNRFNEQSPAPTQQELDGFIKTVNMPEQVAAYRSRATALLEDMVEEAVGGAVENIRFDFDQRLKKFESSLGFWRGVGSNVIAGLATAFIVVALTLFIYGNNIGFANVIGDALGLDIQPKAQPAKSEGKH